MSVKSRNSFQFLGTGRNVSMVGNTTTRNTEYQCYQTVNQKTISSGHRWPPRRKNSDSGGFFVTWRNRYEAEPSYVDVKSTTKWPPPSVGYRYTGPLFPGPYQLDAGTSYLLPTPTIQLNAFGSTGIARSIPTNPLAGMGQFLGELRELPTVPDIRAWRTKALRFRNLARGGSKQYLNVQFGWIPFISDLLKFSSVARYAEKHIKQFSSNSGKNIRRRRTIVDESNTVKEAPEPTYGGNPSIPTPLFDSFGKVVSTVTTTRKVWFSGAFTYYLPDPNQGSWSKAKEIEQLAHHLYGLRITPELLWQLAPWSWAIDWRTNIGDVIHNWSAFQNDGLVMRYGYVMETKESIRESSVLGCRLKFYGPLSSRTRFIQTVKSRLRATPYGFGLDPGGFSSRQWSIIAALGISRVPRSLNF